MTQRHARFGHLPPAKPFANDARVGGLQSANQVRPMDVAAGFAG
jgi:hypothetical protein